MKQSIEALEFAINNLMHQKLRSFLTLIGVIIGIAVIITLLALGQGLKNGVEEQFEKLGSNTIFVAPSGEMSSNSGHGTASIKNLKEADIEKIRKISEVSDVIAPLMSTATMQFGSEKKTVSLIGFDPKETNSLETTGFVEIDEGRMIKSNDAFVAVIGASIKEDFFDKEINLRNRIMIEGKSFRVIGITKKTSTSFGGGPNTNNIVFINEKTFKQISNDAKPSFLLVKTYKKDDLEKTQNKIEKILEKTFGKDQKDYIAMTSEQVIERISQIIGLIQIFLVGIASISLLVGGIGIMNTMIMSVMERTAEIGVMKAIGATNNTILGIFLLEAGFIGIIGGIIGIILGYLFAFAVAAIASEAFFAMKITIDPILIIGALLFAMLVGMASGTYPAIRAAKLDPVEALRKGE